MLIAGKLVVLGWERQRTRLMTLTLLLHFYKRSQQHYYLCGTPWMRPVMSLSPPCQPTTVQLPWIRLGGQQQLLSTSHKRRKSRHLFQCVCVCVRACIHVHAGCQRYRNTQSNDTLRGRERKKLQPHRVFISEAVLQFIAFQYLEQRGGWRYKYIYSRVGCT